MMIFRKKLVILAVVLAALLLGSGSLMAGDAWATGSTCLPCIDLVKTGPSTALPGDVITYEYTVKNCGNCLEAALFSTIR
jgi:hypothetical protein